MQFRSTHFLFDRLAMYGSAPLRLPYHCNRRRTKDFIVLRGV